MARLALSAVASIQGHRRTRPSFGACAAWALLPLQEALPVREGDNRGTLYSLYRWTVAQQRHGLTNKD